MGDNWRCQSAKKTNKLKWGEGEGGGWGGDYIYIYSTGHLIEFETSGLVVEIINYGCGLHTTFMGTWYTVRPEFALYLAISRFPCTCDRVF